MMEDSSSQTNENDEDIWMFKNLDLHFFASETSDFSYTYFSMQLLSHIPFKTLKSTPSGSDNIST